MVETLYLHHRRKKHTVHWVFHYSINHNQSVESSDTRWVVGWNSRTWLSDYDWSSTSLFCHNGCHNKVCWYLKITCYTTNDISYHQIVSTNRLVTAIRFAWHRRLVILVAGVDGHGAWKAVQFRACIQKLAVAIISLLNIWCVLSTQHDSCLANEDKFVNHMFMAQKGTALGLIPGDRS